MLHQAAYHGYYDICKLLIHTGRSYLNHKSIQGFTALYIAAKEGHAAVCALLIQNGAKIDAKTKD